MGGILAFLFWVAAIISIGPLMAGVTATSFALHYGWIYLRTLTLVMARRPSPIPAPLKYDPAQRGAGDEPAYRQYFFGQALEDLRHVVQTSKQEFRLVTLSAYRWIDRTFFDSTVDSTMWPFGVATYFGLWVGVAGGVLFIALVAVAHVVIVLALRAVAVGGIYALRGIDTLLLRAKGIRISCPSCFERGIYPSYDCPSDTCMLRHKDVRPGPYGVLRRTCMCGQRIPTLLLLGSHRLDAYCPICRQSLTEASGTAKEVLLPVFGAVAAGKTQLMLSLVAALEERAARDGGAVTFADETTGSRYAALKPALVRGEPTRATHIELPRAYSLLVTPRSGARSLVHIFDPAGERFYNSQRLQELQYMGGARSFAFVIDPLTVEAFWESLPREDKQLLAPARKNVPPPEFIYQQTVQNVEQMRADPKRCRLGVIISKADLVRGLVTFAEATSDEVLRDWLKHTLGLSNMVRSMEKDFADVRFFATAAVFNETGQVDPSVVAVADWLCANEGLRIGQPPPPAEA
jgi:hypothetical protein